MADTEKATALLGRIKQGAQILRGVVVTDPALERADVMKQIVLDAEAVAALLSTPEWGELEILDIGWADPGDPVNVGCTRLFDSWVPVMIVRDRDPIRLDQEPTDG